MLQHPRGCRQHRCWRHRCPRPRLGHPPSAGAPGPYVCCAGGWTASAPVGALERLWQRGQGAMLALPAMRCSAGACDVPVAVSSGGKLETGATWSVSLLPCPARLQHPQHAPGPAWCRWCWTSCGLSMARTPRPGPRRWWPRWRGATPSWHARWAAMRLTGWGGRRRRSQQPCSSGPAGGTGWSSSAGREGGRSGHSCCRHQACRGCRVSAGGALRGLRAAGALLAAGPPRRAGAGGGCRGGRLLLVLPQGHREGGGEGG